MQYSTVDILETGSLRHGDHQRKSEDHVKYKNKNKNCIDPNPEIGPTFKYNMFIINYNYSLLMDKGSWFQSRRVLWKNDR